MITKKFFILVTLGLIFSNTPVISKIIYIMASTPSYSSLAKTIGGNLVQTGSVISAKQDPHSFEIKPSVLEKVQKSDLFIASDQEYENRLLLRLSELQSPPNVLWVNRIRAGDATAPKTDFQFYTSSQLRNYKQASKLVKDEHQHDHHDHDKDSHDIVSFLDQNYKPLKDIHTHLSPFYLKKQAEAIFKILAILDPKSKNYFQSRLEEYKKNMEVTTNNVNNLLAPYKGKTIFAYHSMGRHFAKYFGFKEYALVSGHAEPSLQDIQQFINALRQSKANFIVITEEEQKKKIVNILGSVNLKIIMVQEFAQDEMSAIVSFANNIYSGFSGE